MTEPCPTDLAILSSQKELTKELCLETVVTEFASIEEFSVYHICFHDNHNCLAVIMLSYQVLLS